MIKSLIDQTDLLKNYYDNAFNKRDLKYLGEVAGKLRLLVYENKSKPLLLSLMDKLNIKIPITLKDSPVEPLLGKPKPGNKIDLRKFLELDAYYLKMPSGNSKWVTKKELIAFWSQQFGSAHQDWSITEEFYEMIRSSQYIGGFPIIALELKETAKTVIYACDEFIKKVKVKLKDNETEVDKSISQTIKKKPSVLNSDKGTMMFWVTNSNLLTKGGEMTVYQSKVEDTEYLIKRDRDMNLIFQHNSPKYGKRISQLNLNQVEKGKHHIIIFSWSPKEVKLHMALKKGKIINGTFKKIE